MHCSHLDNVEKGSPLLVKANHHILQELLIHLPILVYNGPARIGSQIKSLHELRAHLKHFIVQTRLWFVELFKNLSLLHQRLEYEVSIHLMGTTDMSEVSDNL